MRDNDWPETFITKHDHGALWHLWRHAEKNVALIVPTLNCECANCGFRWLEPTPMYDAECPNCDYQPVIILVSGETKQ